MDTPVRYIKSFSKGQITIPKEVRDSLGLGDDFWLKIYTKDGKIISEPANKKTDKALYKKKLLTIKGGEWVSALEKEIQENRQEMEERLQKNAL